MADPQLPEDDELNAWLLALSRSDQAAVAPVARRGNILRTDFRERLRRSAESDLDRFERRLLNELGRKGLLSTVRPWHTRFIEWLRVLPEPGVVYGRQDGVSRWRRWGLWLLALAIATVIALFVMRW